jgi:hypothetical protein
MLAAVSRPLTFELHYYSIDVRGFRSAILGATPKLNSIRGKMCAFDREPTIPPPKDPPKEIPSDRDGLVSFLLWPGMNSAAMFKRIQSHATTLTFADVLAEIGLLTGQSSQVDLLLDLAFDFAWRATDYPFVTAPERLPTFEGVRVQLFGPPFLEERYQKMHVDKLAGSEWPYESVLGILEELHFLLNPVAMAEVVLKAMQEIGRLMPQNDSVGFDHIFPLIELCALAAGLTHNPKLLPFVALAGRAPNDRMCRFAASYAEAIVTHISTLDEQDMRERTMELEEREQALLRTSLDRVPE